MTEILDNSFPPTDTSIGFSPLQDKRRLTTKIGHNIQANISEVGALFSAYIEPKINFINPSFLEESPSDKIPYRDPVLLVHGYMSSFDCFNQMRKKLGDADHHNVYLINLKEDGLAIFGNIDSYVMRLTQRIKEISEQNENNPISIIGHSMGGLVSILAIEKALGMDTSIRIKSLITLGSPLTGTYSANIANSVLNYYDSSLSQMSWNSEFTNRVCNSIDNSLIFHGVDTLHIAGSEDLVVSQSSALPSLSPYKKVSIHACGHMGLLTNSKVTEHVIRHLSNTH
jgi:hypothetical protein